jgi:CubicO group peptidase (beta-lactamase class C family)
MWQDADVGDINRFPSREISTSTASELPVALDERTLEAFGKLDLSFLGFRGLSLDTQDKLDNFLTESETTAFLVVQDGVLINQWYAQGVDHDSLQTSFSVSKSFLSTLIGIAIGQGKIGSLDDSITNYIPELLERDSRFSAITLKHLITMTSGLEYVDEMSPFSDAADTYYSPNLRATALSAVIVEEPGKTFLYNNYNPLLLGMALERATGQKVTDYMSQVLWAPMGAEADGSWSLDSFFSGFEKMESGLNARPVDFARFGLMVARGGTVDGRQVVPQEWLKEATASNNESVGNNDFLIQNYKYFWWVYPDNQFAAQGNKGQFIFIAPDQGTVIVRLGREETLMWPMLFLDLAQQLKDES